MKITALKTQARHPGRVSVFVDDRYSFSLSEDQVLELSVRSGQTITADDLKRFGLASESGKLYNQALRYVLIRPRSEHEVIGYLRHKLPATGLSKDDAAMIFDKLKARGYVDDLAFARNWLANRRVRRGASLRRLRAELLAKGVDENIIDEAVSSSDRSEMDDLRMVIAKRGSRYPDRQKLIQYLVRQGFPYDIVLSVLEEQTD